MSANKFLSFPINSSSTSSSSTFIVNAESKILSIDIKVDDEYIVLPDPSTSEYDVLQYKKSIQTQKDIIFSYAGLQKGKFYLQHQQIICFHKFISTTSDPNWVC